MSQEHTDESTQSRGDKTINGDTMNAKLPDVIKWTHVSGEVMSLHRSHEDNLERVGRDEIEEGMIVDLTINSAFGSESYTFVNAEITQARRIGDELPDFRVESGIWAARIYFPGSDAKVYKDGEHVGTFKLQKVLGEPEDEDEDEDVNDGQDFVTDGGTPTEASVEVDENPYVREAAGGLIMTDEYWQNYDGRKPVTDGGDDSEKELMTDGGTDFPRYDRVPEHMQSSLQAYVEDGRMPESSALKAILKNDLVDAFKYGDSDNKIHMKEWAACLQWDLPADCWGGESQIHDWCEKGGISGMADE